MYWQELSLLLINFKIQTVAKSGLANKGLYGKVVARFNFSCT
jgi:hypothetical protein